MLKFIQRLEQINCSAGTEPASHR